MKAASDLHTQVRVRVGVREDWLLLLGGFVCVLCLFFFYPAVKENAPCVKKTYSSPHPPDRSSSPDTSPSSLGSSPPGD